MKEASKTKWYLGHYEKVPNDLGNNIEIFNVIYEAKTYKECMSYRNDNLLYREVVLKGKDIKYGVIE